MGFGGDAFSNRRTVSPLLSRSGSPTGSTLSSQRQQRTKSPGKWSIRKWIGWPSQTGPIILPKAATGRPTTSLHSQEVGRRLIDSGYTRDNTGLFQQQQHQQQRRGGGVGPTLPGISIADGELLYTPVLDLFLHNDDAITQHDLKLSHVRMMTQI